MGDGGHDATPDGRGASGRGDAQGAQPLSAAPWERFAEPPVDQNAHRWQAEPSAPYAQTYAHTDAEAEAEKAGCHTDGALTVADLIAKIGAPAPKRPAHHHVADGDEEPEVPVDLQDTQVIEAVAYSLDVVSEIPDLAAAHYPADDAPDTEVASSGSRRGRRGRIRRESEEAAGTEERGTRHRRRPVLLAARSLMALAAVLALAMTGGAWQWSTSKNARLNTISALDPHSGDIRDPNGQYGDEDFLIVGMDSRSGENANMGAGDTEDAGGARSDTVMLVNIPANRKRVVAVSFPRDLAITPIQCEAWNPDTGKYGPVYDQKKGTLGPKVVYTETKLNSTFSFGGPKCLVKEIQKLSGLSINRFIAVDFAGFSKMVDALGGVEVCSKSPLHDYELGTVLEHAGRQVVDGPTALNYVRARQVTTETNGDYGRIKRQQLFLSSLLRSLISEDTLFDLNKLNNVVNLVINDTYVDNVQTKDLVQLGQSLQGMAAGHMTFVTVPTGVTDQNGDEPPRMADMRALFDAIINDDPLPQERNADNTPVPKAPEATSAAPAASTDVNGELVDAVTTSPGDVTVRVSNSTGENGLASTAATELQQHGFNVDTPDDYPGPLDATTVFYSEGNEQAAATVASSFANPAVPSIERVSGMGNVIRVVLGHDFNAVNAPWPSGSSMQVHVVHDRSDTTAHLPADLSVTNAADTTCE